MVGDGEPGVVQLRLPGQGEGWGVDQKELDTTYQLNNNKTQHHTMLLP